MRDNSGFNHNPNVGSDGKRQPIINATFDKRSLVEIMEANGIPVHYQWLSKNLATQTVKKNP